MRTRASTAVAAGVGFGFVFLPFLFLNTEKAAEFWGSFLAAITGAAALLAGAWYQDHLSRTQEFERANRASLTEALRLYLWLGWCKQRYDRASERCGLVIEQLQKGAPPTKPLNYGTYRTLLSPIMHSEAEGKAEIISQLPTSVAETIFPALIIISENIDFRNKDVVSDDVPLDKAGFQFHSEQFQRASILMAVAKSRLATFLRGNGIPVSLSGDEKVADEAMKKFEALDKTVNRRPT
jgi:hypothetical protein